MTKIKYGFCDLGDTILLVNKYHENNGKEVLRSLFNTYGYNSSPDQILEAMNKAWETAKSEENFDPGRYAKNRFILDIAKFLGYDISKETAEKMYETLFEYLVEGVEIMPQAVETLEKLKKKGLSWVLITDGLNEETNQMLRKHNLTSIFYKVYTSQNLGTTKASGEFYAKVFTELEIDPESVVLIENDELNIKIAKESGISTVIKVDVGWRKTEFTIADHKVPEFKEVLPIIEPLLFS